MPYLEASAVQEARRMDLLTYLQNFEPQELVKLSGNTYCTREHDSLKISNGKWHWFSRGIGGVSALDYLIKVKGYSFPQAVETITGRAATAPSYSYVKKQTEPRKLLIPDVVRDPVRVKQYLMNRGISSEIIDYCLEKSLLFETADYHNAVFVGYDKSGIARYGAMRGTFSNFKSEVTGSDKRWSFSMLGTAESRQLHLFESAIDLLSYATLEQNAGKDWLRDPLLSLAGVYQTKRTDVVPIALQQYLTDHPVIDTLHLHLDNDEVGRGAAVGIMNGLSGKYTVLDEPPACGKDVNELLQLKLKQIRQREDFSR